MTDVYFLAVTFLNNLHIPPPRHCGTCIYAYVFHCDEYTILL